MPKPKDQQLLSCLNHLRLCGHDKKSTGAYVDFVSSLSDLVNVITPYYTPDKDGRYQALSGDPDSIRKAYQDAIDKANGFADAAADDRHAEGMLYVADKVKTILLRELKVLTDLMPGDEITFPQLSDRVNTHVITMEQALDPGSVGGQLSNRIPLSYTTADGHTVKGFFTENTVLNEEQETDDLIKRTAQGNALYEKALLALTKNADFRARYNNAFNSRVEMDEKKGALIDGKVELKDLFREEINGMISDEKIQQQLHDDERFNAMLMQFVVAYSRVRFKNTYLPKKTGIEKGSPIETRNAAMSAVADLIGVPDTVARSVQMEVAAGGVSRKGVFMQFAEGSETNNMKEGNPLIGVLDGNRNPRITAEADLQTSDLMVVDSICGNTDRHPGNIMFRVGVVNGQSCVTGITGFDNDCSFGTAEPGDKVLRGTAPSQIGFVRKKTAERVIALTKDTLTTVLKGRGLSEKEIDAAWKRTKLLQDALTLALGPKKDQACITVIDDTGRALTADDLKIMEEHRKSHKDSYYAQIYNDIPTQVGNIGANAAAEERQKKLEEKYPIFRTEHSGMQTGALSGIENREPTIEEKNDQTLLRLTTLDADLRRANTGFFISSGAFNKVKGTIKEILGLENKISGDPSVKDYEKSIEKYETLITQTQTYLDKKEKEAMRMVGKGDAPSKIARDRTQFADELLEFAETRLDVLKSLCAAQKQGVADTADSIRTMNAIVRQELLLESDESRMNGGSDPEKEDLLARLYVGKTLNNAIARNGDDMPTSQLQSYTANRDNPEMCGQIKASPAFAEHTSSMKPGDYQLLAEDPNVEERKFCEFTQKCQKIIGQSVENQKQAVNVPMTGPAAGRNEVSAPDAGMRPGNG